VARPGEADLIARYFAPIADPAGLGLNDDAACLTPRPGHDLIVTADALVESVHFLPGDPPGSVARKALGVNVSDLAAKGADPRGFVLTLALPSGWTADWLSAFAEGLGRAARDFDCPLLGGDTVRAAGGLTLSVTALGEVPHGRMVRRTSARPGDAICVTGTIGDAALGLDLRGFPAWAAGLSPGHRAFLADRYLHPRPRHRLAALLRENANAAMDVSDGLAGDLAKMLRVGGVTGSVDIGAVPLSAAAQAAIGTDNGLLERALTGGDDYEILCTVALDRLDRFRAGAEAVGIPAAVIGTVAVGEGPPSFRSDAGEVRLRAGSFSHF
jgi:thiamine-monophosphate kinase